MEFTGSETSSRSVGSSREAQTAGERLLERAQARGCAQRVVVDGKQFYLIQKEGGEFVDPRRGAPDVNRINEIGKVLLAAHKRAGDTLGLNQRYIDYIDADGAHYQDGTIVRHERAKVGDDTEAFLDATDDFDWQQDVLAEHARMRNVGNDEQIPTNRLPQFLQNHLQPSVAQVQASFSGQAIRQGLLEYTRSKVQASHQVIADEEYEVDGTDLQPKIKAWTESSSDVEEIISKSNTALKNNLNARHVWRSMLPFFQPRHAILVQGPIENDDSFGFSPRGSRRGSFSDPLLRPLSPPISRSPSSDDLLLRRDPLTRRGSTSSFVLPDMTLPLSSTTSGRQRSLSDSGPQLFSLESSDDDRTPPQSPRLSPRGKRQAPHFQGTFASREREEMDPRTLPTHSFYSSRKTERPVERNRWIRNPVNYGERFQQIVLDANRASPVLHDPRQNEIAQGIIRKIGETYQTVVEFNPQELMLIKQALDKLNAPSRLSVNPWKDTSDYHRYKILVSEIRKIAARQ